MISHAFSQLCRFQQDRPHTGMVTLDDSNNMCDRALSDYPWNKLFFSQLAVKPRWTNLNTINHEYYHTASILPNVASSDHLTVALNPRNSSLGAKSGYATVPVPSNSHNGRHLLVHALTSRQILDTIYSWRKLKDDIFFYLYSVQTRLSTFLPVRMVTHYPRDNHAEGPSSDPPKAVCMVRWWPNTNAMDSATKSTKPRSATTRM